MSCLKILYRGNLFPSLLLIQRSFLLLKTNKLVICAFGYDCKHSWYSGWWLLWYWVQKICGFSFRLYSSFLCVFKAIWCFIDFLFAVMILYIKPFYLYFHIVTASYKDIKRRFRSVCFQITSKWFYFHHFWLAFYRFHLN